MKSDEKEVDRELYDKLKEFGFEESCILRALQITSDLQKASEIALKLADEGPQADLSAWLPSKPSKPLIKPSEVSIGPFSRAKMLFVVNGELKMGKGKICAQVGHAVIGAYIQMEEEARYDERAKGRLSNWETWGTPKIVVRCESEKEMMNIKKRLEELDIGINTYLVQDAGHTQIKAGSRTVLGIGPAFPEEIDPITQHLKLL